MFDKVLKFDVVGICVLLTFKRAEECKDRAEGGSPPASGSTSTHP